SGRENPPDDRRSRLICLAASPVGACPASDPARRAGIRAGLRLPSLARRDPTEGSVAGLESEAVEDTQVRHGLVHGVEVQSRRTHGQQSLAQARYHLRTEILQRCVVMLQRFQLLANPARNVRTATI